VSSTPTSAGRGTNNQVMALVNLVSVKKSKYPSDFAEIGWRICFSAPHCWILVQEWESRTPLFEIID